MRLIVSTVICAVALSLTAPASAYLGLSPVLEGTVEGISDDAVAILSLSGNVQEMVEFRIDAQTQFEEALLSLNALRIGDRVKVKYREEGKEKVAVYISKVDEDDKQT